MLLDLRSLYEGTVTPSTDPAPAATGGGQDDLCYIMAQAQANLAVSFREQQTAMALYLTGRIDRSTFLSLMTGKKRH